MAKTRAATGNSKPRVLPKVEEVIKPKKTVKKAAPKTKANTSKPRAKTVATGRVSKPKVPAKPKTTKSTTATKKAPAVKKAPVAKKAAPKASKSSTTTTKNAPAPRKKETTSAAKKTAGPEGPAAIIPTIVGGAVATFESAKEAAQGIVEKITGSSAKKPAAPKKATPKA